MSFTKKVVLITGASSGIGAATAISFTKEGANVAIVGRNEERLKEVAEKCAQVGERPLIIKADISKDEEAKTIVDETIKAFGKLNVLINNAAVLKFGNILNKQLLEVYDEVMNTNLRAVIHITTLAAPHIIETHGNIVNISGVGTEMIGNINVMSHGISKSALNYFTRAAARELSPFGVRVNTISSGPVDTDLLEKSGYSEKAREMTALDRISNPGEIADLILYVASDKAKGMTGSNIVSDNGMLISTK